MDEHRVSTYDIEPEKKFDPHLFQSVDQMIVDERNKEITRLEVDIIDLADSFSATQSMIMSQGTDVDTASDAIEYGAGATAAAKKALEESESYTARRRRILASLAGFGIAVGAGLMATAYLFRPNPPNAK